MFVPDCRRLELPSTHGQGTVGGRRHQVMSDARDCARRPAGRMPVSLRGGEMSDLDPNEVARAKKLLQMRGKGDLHRRMAVEMKIKQLPDHVHAAAGGHAAPNGAAAHNAVDHKAAEHHAVNHKVADHKAAAPPKKPSK